MQLCLDWSAVQESLMLNHGERLCTCAKSYSHRLSEVGIQSESEHFQQRTWLLAKCELDAQR